MRDRISEIKSKGFDMTRGDDRVLPSIQTEGFTPVDFAKLKVGAKVLNDAIIPLGDFKKVNPTIADKQKVLKAIDNYDLKTMREISDFFYKTSGIYARILRHMAFLYRYDWFVSSYANEGKTKTDKLLDNFNKTLKLLDDFEVKKTFGEIALKVLRQGAYYAYKIETNNGIVLQELPVDYCRSTLNYGNKPAVEFNLKYFDDKFKDTAYRMRVLKIFPQEIIKAYSLYKKGKLPKAYEGDTNGWFLLDPEMTVKFTANGEDYPMFISAIPLILDLDEAQELDRKKTLQRLLKIVIQKMPLDKNGDLVFDVEEAQQLHNNAVQMLGKAIGIDVLTTFADVTVEDVADTTAASSQADDLERVERQVYNEFGVSQMLFNTDGNIALEKSIEDDAATMYNLLLQFEVFLNGLIKKFNTQPKKFYFRVQLLTTTIYNYKELSKLYKEQTQLGYSKMLPQIALGQSQSSILANAYFENDILDLVNVFVPPMMSSTMNADAISGLKSKDGNSNESGRPEKEDSQKSEKTIQNKESAS